MKRFLLSQQQIIPLDKILKKNVIISLFSNDNIEIMDKHHKIITELKEKYQHDPTIHALLLIGSVARNDYSETSDLDLILITKGTQESNFEEFIQDGITVEIKKDTQETFINKMKEGPMRVYQFLEAKVVFDNAHCLEQLKKFAEEVLKNYKPKDNTALIKWLSSAKIKIITAKKKNDKLIEGYQVSNILWQIIQAIYAINNLPTPASTTAYRKILTLQNLPPEFSSLWKNILTENLGTRSESTIKLIDFALSKL